MVETTFSVSQEVAVNKIWKEKEFHKAKRRESAKAWRSNINYVSREQTDRSAYAPGYSFRGKAYAMQI